MRTESRNFRKWATATCLLLLPVPHKHVLPRKHPAAAVRSPPSSSVLVLELGGWQHDVKLNGCSGSYQVFRFQRHPSLGPSAGCVDSSWLCSVREGDELEKGPGRKLQAHINSPNIETKVKTSAVWVVTVAIS